MSAYQEHPNPADSWDDPDDRRERLVLDCGYPGCCMPGLHFPSECHNAEDMAALFESERVDSANTKMTNAESEAPSEKQS